MRLYLSACRALLFLDVDLPVLGPQVPVKGALLGEFRATHLTAVGLDARMGQHVAPQHPRHAEHHPAHLTRLARPLLLLLLLLLQGVLVVVSPEGVYVGGYGSVQVLLGLHVWR